MYATLLSQALAEHPVDDVDAVLVEELRLSAWALRTHPRGVSVTDTLADELAYDQALIRISAERGIPASPERFAASPPAERARLESALAVLGPPFSEIVYVAATPESDDVVSEV